jgi:multiple sugar transport system substrate-binding protein
MVLTDFSTRSTRRSVVLLAGPAAGWVAGCGRGGAGNESQPAQALRSGVRLTWMYGEAASNPGVREALEGVAREFTAKQPGITVEPLHVTEAYYDKLQGMLVGGTPPDVFWLDVRSFPAYALRGDLAELDPLIRRDRFDVGDFYDRLVKQYVWEGKTRGLPWDMGFQAVFYNRDLFRAAGVALPPGEWKAPGWTFADFTAAAQRLTVAAGERPSQYGFVNSTQWVPWVYANGGRQINAEDTEAMLHRPEAIGAFQHLRDLMHRHRVAPTPAEAREWNPVQAFMGGRAAMVVTAAATGTTSFRQIDGFSWDVAPMPRGPGLQGDRRTHGGGSGWMLSSQSKNRDESWALFKHVTGKDAALSLARVGWSPPRQSVGTSTVWLDPKLPPQSKPIYRDAIEHIITNPRILT